MADYGGGISLSQAHTSEDESSDHSPRSIPKLSSVVASSGGGGSSMSKTPSSKITTLDHLHQTSNTARKPRGRPPGSKNKPKPPIVITRDSDSAMKPAILDISAGADIIDSIISFSRRQFVGGLCVISAAGTVSDVVLRQPNSHAPPLTLHGPFNILSITGSFLCPSPIRAQQSSAGASSSSSSSSSSCSFSALFSSSFGVTLGAGQGHVIGGIIGGKMIAASHVVVVVGTFMNPSFSRLPYEGNNEADHHRHPQDQMSIRPSVHSSVGANHEAGSSSGMPIGTQYGVVNPPPISSQIAPDLMPWGPSSRPY